MSEKFEREDPENVSLNEGEREDPVPEFLATEASSREGEDGWISRLPLGVKRAAAVILASGFGAGAAQASEAPIGKQQLAKVSLELKRPESKITAQQLESQVKSLLSRMGNTDKVALVNELKGDYAAGTIRAVLTRGDYNGNAVKELLWAVSPGTKQVLQTYLSGLQEIQKSDPAEYARTIIALDSLLTMVQTKTPQELQKEFSK